MFSRSSAYVAAALLLCSLVAFAGDNKSSKQPAAPKMDNANRLELIRSLNAELVFIRHVFPIGNKGLSIRDGKLSPSEAEIQSQVATYGPAARPGDRAKITNMYFKGDNRLIFEINGGPRKKTKWYEHISVGMGSGEASPTTTKPEELNARGSYVELVFDKYVPQMSADQVKDLLKPVFDFNAVTAAEAYMDSVPPKLKEAIKSHHVLVGMNREMVTYALGRPPKKYREADYEEWIYGAPPDPVQFVRFRGDEVVRLEIMKVDGEKIVRTEKEIDMNAVAQAQQEPAAGQQAGGSQATAGGQSPAGEGGPTRRPSLRRPGEAPTSSTDMGPNGPDKPLPDPSGKTTTTRPPITARPTTTTATPGAATEPGQNPSGVPMPSPPPPIF